MNFQLIKAKINPGIPAKKMLNANLIFLPVQPAVPEQLKNQTVWNQNFVKNPCLNPWRPLEDSFAINDCINGKVGPSKNP